MVMLHNHKKKTKLCTYSVYVHFTKVMDHISELSGQKNVSHSMLMRVYVHCRRSQDILLLQLYKCKYP